MGHYGCNMLYRNVFLSICSVRGQAFAGFYKRYCNEKAWPIAAVEHVRMAGVFQ